MTSTTADSIAAQSSPRCGSEGSVGDVPGTSGPTWHRIATRILDVVEAASSNAEPSKDRWESAAVKETLALLSGKWTIDLLAALWSGPRRPIELRADLPQIQERVLLSTLATMVERDLVHRSELPAVPVSRVEYTLAARAYDLDDLLRRLDATSHAVPEGPPAPPVRTTDGEVSGSL